MKALVLWKPGPEGAALCAGPTRSGACPRVPAGEPVACAGRRVFVAAGPGPLMLKVEPDATVCPLATMGVAGSGATAHQERSE